MDFFNKAKSTLANTTKDLTQKASDVGGLAKVTAKIFELDKQYNDGLKKLAETLYSQKYEEVKALCPDIIEALDTNRKNVEEAKKEQAILKGMKICPNCGAEQEKNAVRCTVCGIEMASVENYINQ